MDWHSLAVHHLNNDCSTDALANTKLLSIIAVVLLLAEPLDCTGGALVFRGTSVENHWSVRILRLVFVDIYK